MVVKRKTKIKVERERETEHEESSEQGRCEQKIMTDDREIKTSSCEENNV